MSDKKTLILNPAFTVRGGYVPPWVNPEQERHLAYLGDRVKFLYQKLDGSFGNWADWEAASREFHNYRAKLGM